MIISLIVAVSENNVIGKDNDLVWNLPDDMKFFKKTTNGHFVIMGRKNYESIPEKFRPLPNRTNVIITRQTNFQAKDCLVVNDINQALDLAKNAQEQEAFIIGGGQIYQLALQNDLVDRIYLTRIHDEFEGDTFFPELSEQWKEVHRQWHPADEKHNSSFSFITLEK
ncbi:MAG: dihydrofolate reductase [Bacteroidota bacterium]|nr:dihydrofolate reductase [Bacteroidota bacterium]MEE3037537.1 dihydrofolate reductase [Bacteroidota bacterium]